jgi:glycosyltransferase involved in cell wall biosynthesis
MSVPRISVIIPAWNEAVRVERLLQALAAQTLDSSLFEVIVIDNGSTDGTADAARKFPVTVLEEPQPGSYRARNAGLAQVRGEYVAFTDADCTPRRTGWSGRLPLPKPIRRPACSAAGSISMPRAGRRSGFPARSSITSISSRSIRPSVDHRRNRAGWRISGRIACWPRAMRFMA